MLSRWWREWVSEGRISCADEKCCVTSCCDFSGLEEVFCFLKTSVSYDK